jgi:hypothetical protein
VKRKKWTRYGVAKATGDHVILIVSIQFIIFNGYIYTGDAGSISLLLFLHSIKVGAIETCRSASPSGDFIAVSNLVTATVALLRASHHSPTEYQNLVAELANLDKALNHLDGLCHRGRRTEQILDSIRFSAVTCRQPLESFLKKIKKYDTSLNATSARNKLRAFPRKLQGQFSMKEECQRLQSYLNLHLSSINALLLQYGLDTMELEGKAAVESSNEVKGLILAAREKIDQVSGDLSLQGQLITQTNGVIEKLIATTAEWSGPWKALHEMVSRIW